MNAERLKEEIVDWIRDIFKQVDGPAIIGISGGKDSTVCAALLAEALGKDRVVGVLMPNGKQNDISDSWEVIERLGIKSKYVNIEQMYNNLELQTVQMGFARLEYNQVWVDTAKPEQPIPEHKLSVFKTNTPARLRMTVLYSLSAIYGGLVCNTCNKSEDFIGYSSKYGDSAGDFAPISDLTVTEVRELGKVFSNIPGRLVMKVPSDGMCGKSDEDNLGFTYDELDDYIEKGDRSKIRQEVKDKIVRMHNNINTAYKMLPMSRFVKSDYLETL